MTDRSIAFHIVSDAGWGVPASYSEGFWILACHGIIDADLAARMARAAGLQNRIANGYAALDLERLWGEIPDGLAALDQYAAAVARHAAA